MQIKPLDQSKFKINMGKRKQNIRKNRKNKTNFHPVFKEGTYLDALIKSASLKIQQKAIKILLLRNKISKYENYY